MSLTLTHSRIQHGVGQGSFHSASIEIEEGGRSHRFDYVYDCGALTGGARTIELERAIRRMDVAPRRGKGKEKVIDLLVLSHYDQDHINGAELLVAKCNVKRIVVPYLGTDELALVLASQAEDISSALVTALHTLAHGGQTLFGVKVTSVRPRDEDAGGIRVNDDVIDPDSGDAPKDDQAGGEWPPRSMEPRVGTNQPMGPEMKCSDDVLLAPSTQAHSPLWRLRFWNRGVDKTLLNLVEVALKKCGFPLNDLKNKAGCQVVTQWLADKENRKKAVQAYQNAIATYAPTWQSEAGSRKIANFLSLGLYSGLSREGKQMGLASKVADWLPASTGWSPNTRAVFDFLMYGRNRRNDFAGWLGTGDAPLGEKNVWADFEKHYANELPLTRTVLVPHHGAAPSGGPRFYNPGLHPKPGMLAVISAGKNNRYGHPRAAVMKQIMTRGASIEMVTEDTGLGLHEVFVMQA